MSGPIILHIEDDSNDVLLLDHACRQAGLQVNLVSLAESEQAFAYLRGDGKFANRAQFPLPRLVLLDLKGPHLSGFDVLRWMRSQGSFRHLPVVVLSSSNYAPDLQRSYELGANSYVVKPVGFEALVGLIKAIHHYWLELNQVPVDTPSRGGQRVP